MRKDKRNVLIFFLVISVSVVLSILLYNTNMATKLKGGVRKEATVSDYPVIDYVINSSGSKYVNGDIAIIVRASSNYNIVKVEYSFDMKNWHRKKLVPKKNINYKMIYTNDMDKTLYVRVVNDKGYKSYVYKTYLKIDKTSPNILKKDNNIYVEDNNELSMIQYSNDKINWNINHINSKTYTTSDVIYKYVRVVDHIGNVSETVEINNN